MTEPTTENPTVDVQDSPVTPVSAITDQDRKFVETWENVGPGTTGIMRLDARGDVRHEMIKGQRSFFITTEERMITQERILTKELDPFMNGTFRPIVVPDSVTIESNPNALSDSEIVKILKSSDLAWGEWMQTIDSVATLHRMMETASTVDDFSLKRYRDIEARLAEVRPNAVTNDPALQEFLEPPSRRDRTGRRRNGQSADYR